MRDKPLTFYVDRAWKREAIHSPLMQPWWGNPWGKNSLFAMQMFDSYPYDERAYLLTENSETADMVLAPYRHNWLLRNDPSLLRECEEASRRLRVPLLIDGAGDVEYPVDIEGAIVLRVGGYRFKEEKGRLVVPIAADDLLERCRNGRLSLRKKTSEKPVVGFAGWTRLTPRQAIRNTLKELPSRAWSLVDERYAAMRKGVLWRRKALSFLEASPLVTLRARERDTFSGNTKTAQADLETLREEFVQTIEGCDYGLEVRGDANASTRLFEILSLGRIPVILDTERNFPFADEVDYREFCLIVDFRDLQKLPRIISAFHEEVSPQRFEEMQQKGREAFVRYFRTDSQIRHIVPRLERMLHARIP